MNRLAENLDGSDDHFAAIEDWMVPILIEGKEIVLRNQGKRPFAYIEEDNQPAINLVSKLGFERDKKVHWFRVKPAGPAAPARDRRSV